MENIGILRVAKIETRARVGRKINFPGARLAKLVGFLPAEKSPTVSRLADSAWVAVEVILEERQERELIPALKRAGATGIIDRKSTRLNSSHANISYAVFCLKKKNRKKSIMTKHS